jgi:hypothetical protein
VALTELFGAVDHRPELKLDANRWIEAPGDSEGSRVGYDARL